MGCGDSKASFPAPLPPLALQPKDGQVVAPVTPHLLAAAARKPQRQGTGTDEGKDMGKGKGKGSANISQIMLDGKFQDNGSQDDSILKNAYTTGHEHAKFHLRGQSYEHLIVITVGLDQPGTMIVVKDPNNPGQHVQVYVPARAKSGQKMAVPIPEKGQSVEVVQQKQKKHDAEHGTKTSEWSIGGKVAAGGAAVVGVAAVGVGGVILGDYRAGGDIAETIREAAGDVSDWAADAAGDAADWAADAGGDAGEWAADAAEDAGEWLESAGEEIADFSGDAADWFGDAGEDIGDFVMDLF